MLTQYVLGFVAGALSLLAPCVLPLLPMIVSNSLRSSKWGPLLSAAGLTFSFTLFGILTSSFASVFDPDVIRDLGAVILLIVGLLYMFPALKNASSSFFNRLSSAGMKMQMKLKQGSVRSEFLGGALLGMIWSPCTGPTLAFAIGIASQADQLLHASMIFVFFGLGAGLGMLSLGFLVKKFSFLRVKLLNSGEKINKVAGFLSLIVGLLILLKLEGYAEELILELMPQWLINFTVKY